MENNTKKGIQVSDQFIHVYKHFNVIYLKDEMDKLTRSELILLLVLAVDSFSEENPIVIKNFTPYKDELDLIYQLQNDEEVTDEDILFLSKETASSSGEKYIDTKQITDTQGDRLPDPLTDDQARILRRDIGIDGIIEN